MRMLSKVKVQHELEVLRLCYIKTWKCKPRSALWIMQSVYFCLLGLIRRLCKVLPVKTAIARSTYCVQGVFRQPTELSLYMAAQRT